MLIMIDKLDLSLQTRMGTDTDTVNTYAEAMGDGAIFPNVTVFTDGYHFWLADGFHRVAAAQMNRRTCIQADVMRGSENDAILYGGTANNKQGKRPTRADTQHFLEMVWERRNLIFSGTPTGGNLAKRCGVSRMTGERFVQMKLAEMPESAPVTMLQVKKMPERGDARGDACAPETNGTGLRPEPETNETGLRPEPLGGGKCKHADAQGFCSDGNSAGSRCCHCAGYEPAMLKMPVRPTRLVGADGKLYPVRPPTRRGYAPNPESNGTGLAPRTPVAHGATPAHTEANGTGQAPNPGAQGNACAPQDGTGLRPEPQGHVVPTDRYGVEIPLEIQAAFDGIDDIKEVVGLISAAKCQIANAKAAGNPAFAAMRQDVQIQLENAYNFAKHAMAHCVCRMCQGNGCAACHNRGWQTDDEYKRNPREFRADG